MASIKRFRVSFNGGLPDMIAFGITRSSVARKAKALYGPAVIAGVTSISARGAEGMAFMPLPWNSISEAGYMDPPKTKAEVKKRYPDIETDVKNKKSKDLQAVTVKEELQVKKVKITASSPDANKDGKVDKKDDLNGDGVVDAKDVKIAELEKDLQIKQLESELDLLDDPEPEEEETTVPMPERPSIKDRDGHFEVIDHTGKTLKKFKYDSSAEGTASREARHQARMYVSKWYHDELTKAVDAGKSVPMPQEFDSAAAGKKESPKEKKKFAEALTLLQKKKQMDDTVGEEIEEEDDCDEMEEAVDPSHQKILNKAKNTVPRKPATEYDRKVTSYLKKKYTKEEQEVKGFEMIDGKARMYVRKDSSPATSDVRNKVKTAVSTLKTQTKKNWSFDTHGTDSKGRGYMDFIKEEEMEEGNAFIFAAAKAKQAGKKTFTFNGKKYKVTLKAHSLSEDFDDEEVAFMAEAIDGEKLTMLARAGMVSRDQLATLKMAMKSMEDEKPLRPQQRSVIIDLFTKLADLATNDPAVFQKAKKFAKEEVVVEEVEYTSANFYADYIKSTKR